MISLQTARRGRLRAVCTAGAATLAALAALATSSSLHAQPVAASPAANAPATKPVAKPVIKTADKPVWSQLSPAQQVALEPLHGEWDAMEGVRKQKWLELANHFATMKPEEQQRVHEKMRAWVKLTPDQRKLARQNYAQAKTISPVEKSATWESYKQLPVEQKQKLAEQAVHKPLTNLPSAKAVQRSQASALHGALACPAGSVRNTASPTPACIPAPAPQSATPPAVAPSIVTPAPAK